jgi:hypothetical protein
MRTLIHALALVVALPATAQTAFERLYGTAIYGPPAFAAAPDAHYLLHGTFTGPVLMKVDLDGTLLWTRTLNFGAIPVGVSRIAYEDDALYITGGHQNAGYRNFLAKLDTDGNVLWTTEINPGDININSRIHVLPDGVLLVGQRDLLDGSAYTFDLTLMRFAADGSFLWGKAYGPSSYNLTGLASVVATNGDVVVAGTYSVGSSPNHGPEKLMLARFTSAGDLLWMTSHEDPANFLIRFRPADLIATSDGRYALVGSTFNSNNNWDAHVLVFDEEGTIEWARRLYRIGWYETARTLIEDSQQRLVVGGWYGLSPDNGHLGVRLDLDGNLIDAVTLDGIVTEPAPAEYEATGRDLAERVGFGYVSSSVLNEGSGIYRHSLVSFPYAGLANCPGVSNGYPLEVSVYSWTAVPFTALPGANTAISGSAVTFTSAALTDASEEMCPLITGAPELIAAGTDLIILQDPAHDVVTIQWTAPLGGSVSIDLLDARGAACTPPWQAQLPAGIQQHALPTGSLGPGIYLIRLTTDAGVRTGRFMVAR